MINDLKNPQFRKGKSKSFISNILVKVGLGSDAVLSLFTGLLASALILYSGYVLYDTFYVQNQAYSAWDVLREYKPDLSDLDGDKVPQQTWETMQEIVKDYRSWITVYDTTIDYPVVQGEDDLYYAHTDIYGEPSLTGAIYLAAENSSDFSDSYNLIYGHHMDNGAMFGALDSFAGEEFFNEHREGIIITRDKIYDFKTFAVINTDAYESIVYNVSTEKNFKELIAHIKENAVQFDETLANKATKILALSTCISALTNGRLVVFGELKERKIGDERDYINPTEIVDNPKDAGPADGGYKYYDVNFFKELGDTDVYAYERVRSDTKVAVPEGPEKEGYTFAYWGDKNGNVFNFDDPVISDSNLYAYYNINQYTVNYHNEDGAETLYTRLVDYNNKAENLDIPQKDGYYAYWSTTPDGGAEFDFTKPVKGEIDLYVVYKAIPEKDYTVKYYDENGKLIEKKTVGIDEGFKAENNPIPEKDGYDSYWSRTPDGEPFDFNTVLENDIELYRVYKSESEEQYTITYYNEDGTEVVETKTINAGDKAEELSIPAKDGYISYWSTTPDGDTPFDFDNAPSGDVTLYQVYKPISEEQYTVTYYNEDGTEVLHTVEVDYNNAAEKFPIPEKEGYYAYWSETIDGKTEFDFTNPIKGETKLYIVYKLIPEEDYTVKYYDEDGNLIEEKTVGVDDGFKAENNPIPEKDGYDSYWSATPDGKPFDFNTVLENDIELYIVYKPSPDDKHTVTYFNEDGTQIVESTTVNDGGRAEKLPIPEKEGYYAYWSETIDGRTEFDFGSPINAETRLYIVYKAIPEEDYTVKYYDENGNLIEEKTVGVDGGFKAENSAIPAKDGYYTYWSSTPDGDPFDFNTVLDGDIKLYRVYKPVSDRNGGSGSAGGTGSGTSDGGDGNDGGGNGDGDGNGSGDGGDDSKNPFETLIEYFRPTGTSYNVNGRPAWALVNLVALIITIYILFPILHVKAKYGRGKMMNRINEQKKDLWEAKALREREEFVRDSIRKQALENRKKENEGVPLVQVDVTEEEFDDAVEDLYYKVKKFLNRFRAGVSLELVVSVVALITFILTEDMRLPMILIDRWTPLMLLFLFGCWITDVILARYRRKTEGDVEYQSAQQGDNQEKEQGTKVH
ncbi:MAG: class B sortase [Clostridiales bacterium]|nr:class B sortase [Clostridiales bacterium]